MLDLQLRYKLEKVDKKDSYAFIILRNSCFDKLKKTKHTFDFSYMHSTSYEDNDRLELQDLKNKIAMVISRLPESQKMILQLRNIENYSIKQIADELEMKPNTVEVNLSRARKTIRENLKD